MSVCIKKILFTFLCCLFTLPALAENTILIMGDSLSAGYGIELEKSWVALLKQRLINEKYPYRVINASISGDTTSDGLARLPTALKTYHPTITLIELGGNDGLRGLNIALIKKNLQQLITLTKTAKSKVLLIGIELPPNYGPIYTQQFQQIFVDLAKENKIAFVPSIMKGIGEHLILFQSDGIHPTADAQILLLNNIWPPLKEMLAKQ